MEANIIFNNVKVYNVEKFDVKLGETFKIELLEQLENLRWFADNDPVLEIEANGETAVIKATKKGKCEIQIQQLNQIVKIFYIEIYDANMASNLNVQSETPVLK